MAKQERVTISSGFEVTPHDTNNLSKVTYGLYVGGTGDLKVDFQDGTTVTFKAVPAGTQIRDVRIKKIYATGTTATLIVALA